MACHEICYHQLKKKLQETLHVLMNIIPLWQVVLTILSKLLVQPSIIINETMTNICVQQGKCFSTQNDWTWVSILPLDYDALEQIMLS